MSVIEIRKTVSALPDKERAKLAAWILDSLPPASDQDASADSIEEAVRRRAELNSGKVVPLTNEEFWESIAQERNQWT
jgi:putative addiction module component (TIGR02574 family)